MRGLFIRKKTICGNEIICDKIGFILVGHAGDSYGVWRLSFEDFASLRCDDVLFNGV